MNNKKYIKFRLKKQCYVLLTEKYYWYAEFFRYFTLDDDCVEILLNYSKNIQ